MPKGPIRRSQLVAPFGVGALSIVRDGTSVITCGLDHWFKKESSTDPLQDVDAEEFRIDEWRLSRLLGVDHFMLPPDFRIRRATDKGINYYLTVPFLRFPTWHFCPSCHQLYKRTLTERTKPNCAACEKTKKWQKKLLQVPFVAMCDRGHLMDFPWCEWVHRSAKPTCNKPLFLISTGGASLGAQKVKCDCGAERSLAQITEALSADGMTYLSKNLVPGGDPFLCSGPMPWLGLEEGRGCERPIRGSLRSASNLYYAEVKSAIYLPRRNDLAPAELISILENPPYSTLINILVSSSVMPQAAQLRKQFAIPLQPFSDAQIEAGLELIVKGNSPKKPEVVVNQTGFRYAEYRALIEPRDEPDLLVKAGKLEEYQPNFTHHFLRVMLIHKLRETRALAGFGRVFPVQESAVPSMERFFWRMPPRSESWLPAYTVFGEGLFFELKPDLLRLWESETVKARVKQLQTSQNRAQQRRKADPQVIPPALVLLHTLAHLLMNRLTFECGYSSAALRERLYVSGDPKTQMAGLLIYTAAGDAEGTLGGLVRMGAPGLLEAVLQRALEAARWCSADPVCMEMGMHGGQGPDSCNLAACHNCALVPETACEGFNRFLDRALLVGDPANMSLGYFNLTSGVAAAMGNVV